VTPLILEQWLFLFRSDYHFSMKKSVIRAFIALLSVPVVFGQFSVAASGGCTVNHEELSVLATVLKSISAQSRSVLVVESRTDSSHSAREFTTLGDLLFNDAASDLSSRLQAAPSGGTVFLTTPPAMIPEVRQHELEREYDIKKRQPCKIPSTNTGSKMLVFKTPAELKQIFSGDDPHNGWRRFHKLFGDDAALVRFSRVAFDSSKQYAIVHISSGSAEMSGGGELYLLRRLNGSWAISRTFSTWTT
jgi:hypothetical protein